MLARMASAVAATMAIVLSALLAAGGALADDRDAFVKSYRKTGAYDDIKFDLTNAITNRGLVVDHNGNLGGMLERTGKDVGSTKPVYKAAEYFTFCSAKLSREMLEADPANTGFCPYVIFMYATAEKPGEVVVGYRRPPQVGTAASKKALAAIETLLDGIVKEAVK